MTKRDDLVRELYDEWRGAPFSKERPCATIMTEQEAALTRLAFDAGLAAGRELERADVVAWLRTQGVYHKVADTIADLIKRDIHRRPSTEGEGDK